MDTAQKIISQVKDCRNKSILEIDNCDDSLTAEFSKAFKKVYSYYQFLKAPSKNKGNVVIKKQSYLKVLKQLGEFDVIFFSNEFHHFPDVWQMRTYKKLGKHQDLFLKEWDMTGNGYDFYKIFLDCLPLEIITRQVMSKCVSLDLIEIKSVTKGKYEQIFTSKDEFITDLKPMLGDHWQFGVDEFMSKLKCTKFPLRIWEFNDLFHIVKK